MAGKRAQIRATATQLRQLLDHKTAAEDLTPDQRDQAAELRDRLYEIADGMDGPT